MKREYLILLGCTALLATKIAQASPPASAPSKPAGGAAGAALKRVTGDIPAGRAEQIAAVHSFGNRLPPEEISALYAFLKTAPTNGMTNPDGLNWLKNDILNALREQQTPPPGLTQLLIGLYHDHAQDSVMRDYAIQHLVLWSEHGAPDAPESKSRIRDVLREAAGEYGAIAGTAVLGWHRLSRVEDGLDPAEIDQCALRLVMTVETDQAARLTAIQVCAERGLTAALPAIAPLTNTPSCVPLRLSAAAAFERLCNSQPPSAALGPPRRPVE